MGLEEPLDLPLEQFCVDGVRALDPRGPSAFGDASWQSLGLQLGWVLLVQCLVLLVCRACTRARTPR